jgi:hypothetical protein
MAPSQDLRPDADVDPLKELATTTMAAPSMMA